MSDERMAILRKLGLPTSRKRKQTLTNSAADLGQSYPQHCPPSIIEALAEPLGDVLSIRDVARIIGCSPWTIRQKYIPAGLPHHRLTANGKLTFYRNQIIRWLIRRQKGEVTP